MVRLRTGPTCGYIVASWLFEQGSNRDGSETECCQRYMEWSKPYAYLVGALRVVSYGMPHDYELLFHHAYFERSPKNLRSLGS